MGPKATTRWLLRMVPKGRSARENFYIDEDTKNHLLEVVRFLRAKGKSKLLPIVAFEDKNRPQTGTFFNGVDRYSGRPT